MKDYIKINIPCPICSGSGLYVDWLCEKGEAIPCRRCKSSGTISIKIKIFVGISRRKDINTVKLENGSILSYEDWFKKTKKY